MATLWNPETRSDVEARVRSLRPDSVRHWGRMSPHETICHLSDAFRMALGERDVRPRGMFKPVVRFVALHLPFNWPQGRIRTIPEAEQGIGGTPPVEFERDRAELLTLIARFCAAGPDERPATHPLLGAMSTNEWGRWGYRHLDHHLRQFGA